jgi:hypothetical protein
MKKVKKTFYTYSFFPNASIAASASTFIDRWISFGRNTITDPKDMHQFSRFYPDLGNWI